MIENQNNFNNQGMQAQSRQMPGEKTPDVLLMTLISLIAGAALVILFSIIYAVMRNGDFSTLGSSGSTLVDGITNVGKAFNFLGLAFQIIALGAVGALLFLTIKNKNKIFVKIGLIITYTFTILSVGKVLTMLFDSTELAIFLELFKGNKNLTAQSLLAVLLFFVAVGWAGVTIAFFLFDKNTKTIIAKIEERRAMNAVHMQQQAPQGFNPTPQPQQQAPQGFNPTQQPQQQAPQGFNPTQQPQQQAPQGFNPTPQPQQQAPQGFNPTPQQNNTQR